MSSKRRLSQNLTASANKLRLDTLNKILKIDSSKGKKHKREAITKQVSRVVLSELLNSNNSTKIHDLPDFKKFLSNKSNIEVFREFLKTQYCHENIDFYLACEKYRQLDPDKVGKDLIKFMATQIYNDYLCENARQQVNINYSCLQNITRQMKDPQPNMLCDAQTEIFNLMMSDCYPRFYKTCRLDRETATKILGEQSIDSTLSTPNKTSITNNNVTDASIDTTSLRKHHHHHSSISSIATSCSTTSKSSLETRSSKLKLPPTKSNSYCPTECPYYRVGLPCLQHNPKERCRFSQKGTSDLIDKIDLSRMHHVPNYCVVRRSPPPPPLPPKPDYLEISTSPVINKKNRPYVGKVFNV